MSTSNARSDFESLIREALGPPSNDPMDPNFCQRLAFEAGRAEGKRSAWRWGSGGLLGGVLLGLLGSNSLWPIPSPGLPTLESHLPRMAKTPSQDSQVHPDPRDPTEGDPAENPGTFLARSLPRSPSSIWNPLTDPDQVNRNLLAPGGTQYISTNNPNSQKTMATNLRSISEVMEDLK